MRVVDVCAFYSPQGGGVRTYVERKWRVLAEQGHEMIVLAPGERDEVVERQPGALLATIAAPRLPVDRRYRYFDDEPALHRALDRWRPDFVEVSSPWSSASMVARWQGPAPRSLIMHADPLATYAYRWFGRIAPRRRDVVFPAGRQRPIERSARDQLGGEPLRRVERLALPELSPKVTDKGIAYRYVEIAFDRAARKLELGPDGLTRECAPDEVGLLLARINALGLAVVEMRQLPD